MHARHRAPRGRSRTVKAQAGGQAGQGTFRVESRLVVLTLTGMATATLFAAVMSGLAGATETAGRNKLPAGASGGTRTTAEPYATWYSEWSSGGSGGIDCDPMALRWC